MRLLLISLVCISLAGCGISDPKLAASLKDAQASEQKSHSQYEDALAAFQKASAPILADEIQADRKAALYVTLLVRNYQAQHNQLPSKVEDLRSALKGVPAELISGNSRLSYTPDQNGGWVLDQKTLLVTPNLDPVLLQEKTNGNVK